MRGRIAHQELATVQSLQGNTDARLNFDYQYDPLGNITSIDDLNPTPATMATRDALGRTVKVEGWDDARTRTRSRSRVPIG